MNNFTKEELKLIQRALLCMIGVSAAADNKLIFVESQKLNDKVSSLVRSYDLYDEEEK